MDSGTRDIYWAHQVLPLVSQFKYMSQSALALEKKMDRLTTRHPCFTLIAKQSTVDSL